MTEDDEHENNHKPVLTGYISVSVPYSYTLKVGNTITVGTMNLGGTRIVCYQWWRETGTNSWSWSLTDSNSTFLLTSAVLGQRIRLTVYRTGYYGVMNYTTSAVTD